jgi:hypothetical protein
MGKEYVQELGGNYASNTQYIVRREVTVITGKSPLVLLRGGPMLRPTCSWRKLASLNTVKGA